MSASADDKSPAVPGSEGEGSSDVQNPAVDQDDSEGQVEKTKSNENEEVIDFFNSEDAQDSSETTQHFDPDEKSMDTTTNDNGQEEKSVDDPLLQNQDSRPGSVSGNKTEDAQNSSETTQHLDPEEKSMDTTTNDNDNDNGQEDKSADDPLLQNQDSRSGSVSGNKTEEESQEDSVSKLLCVQQELLSEEEKSVNSNPLTDNDNSNSNISQDSDHGGKKQKLEDEVKDRPESDSGVVEASPPENVSNIPDEGSRSSMAPNKTSDADEEDENEDCGVRLRVDGIFEEDDDDDVVEVPNDDSQIEDPPDIESMLQMSFREGDSQESSEVVEIESGNDEFATRRPRRAAATAAANSIREISNEEAGTNGGFRRRGNRNSSFEELAQIAMTSKMQNCQFCKKRAQCDVKLQQYGTEIYFCSNKCFSSHRSMRNNTTGIPLCANGTCRSSSNTHVGRAFYWETMSFCSDRCVGNYQVQVGGRCATCSNGVPWLSLGKYCVRFGSDIRQFCCAQCLEMYKKNARVCFHCQLDIKRLGNVILANLPAKQTPKEFCSQDCVEMYVEQNISYNMKSKSSQSCICGMCGEQRNCFKELVLSSPKSMNIKACSELCWHRLLESKAIRSSVKCETCTKYYNFDVCHEYRHYVSTNDKVYGFCSATCKNVFVLKHREILACISCRVKKYNYDLIQSFQGKKFMYASCSLNCLPCSLPYIQSLRSQIGLSDLDTGLDQSADVESFPVIQSVSSMSNLMGHPNTYMDQSFVIDNYGNIVPAGNSGSTTTAVGTETENSRKGLTLSEILSLDTPQMKEFLANATASDIEMLNEIAFEDNWDGVITSDIIDDVLSEMKMPPEMVTRYTMAKPICSTASTQTDESAITDMERIPLKTVTDIKYVPFPMPIPVYIPVPVYLMETPVPYPFPLPIPVPVPIPVLFNKPESLSKPPIEIVPESEDVEMTDLEKGEDIIQQPTLVPEESVSDSMIPRSDCNEREQQFSHASNDNESMSSNLSVVASSAIIATSPVKKKLTRVEYGIRAWKMSFGPNSDPISFNPNDLAEKLAEWVKKGTKPNGARYRADIILYLCLGVQQHLKENGDRKDNIFYDVAYYPFVDAITNYAEADCAQAIGTRIEDSHFWESSQLGDSSPGVLLFTLIYLLYKNFHLKTWEKHAALHFGQVKIERKFNPASGKEASFLRIEDSPDCEGIEVVERPDMPEKCLVRLLSLYSTKCAHPDGQFYKAIKIDDPTDFVWYSEEVLDQMKIYQMLVRAMMIKTESDG